MTYVDGFVLPVKNLRSYKKMAELGAKVWKKHGALEYFECVGDDLSSDISGLKGMTFLQLVKPNKGEKIVFSFIVYKNKKHRNEVNKKVMKDPLMNDPKYQKMPMPFDMKRMVYGGFRVLVEK